MPFGIDLNVKTDSGAMGETFERINKNLDKIPEMKRSAKKYIDQRSKPLAAAGTAAGAGILYKKIRDAQKDRLNREKIKSEKEYYDLLNERLKKEAALSDNAKKTIMDAAAMTGAGMATVGGIKGAATIYDTLAEKLSNKEKEYWDKFTRRFPEYKDNDQAKEAFRLLLDSSPNLAKHPIAVRSFVKQILMKEQPTVNFGTLREVGSIESNFNRRTNSTDGQLVHGVDRIIRNAKQVLEKEQGGNPQ